MEQFFVAIFGIFCSSPIQLDSSEVAPQVVHHVLIEAESWIRSFFLAFCSFRFSTACAK